MQFKILDSTKIDDIKDAFIKQFPHLKLEFFSHRQKTGRSPVMSDMICGNDLLRLISRSFRKGTLTILPTDTVASLEQNFQRIFGLTVRIFRKQKSSWTETSHVNNLTLEEQNTLAREACGIFPEARPTSIIP